MKIRCEICGFECDSKIFSSHLKHKHDITSKDYYDRYLKKENEGFCVVCGKPTKLIGFRGYRKYCCRACSTQDSDVKEKAQQTIREHFGSEGLKSSLVREKARKTSLEKYGTENPSQSDKVKEKVKKTNLERYSVEYVFQSEMIKSKIKETNFKKYGFEYSSQNEEQKIKTSKTMKSQGLKKQRTTNIDRYGVLYVNQLAEIKEKKKQTCLKRFGEDNPLKVKAIREQIKQTNLEKYCVENIGQLPNNRNSFESQEKRKNTNLQRWGVDNPIQNKEIRNKRLQTLKENGTFNTSALEVYFKSRCDDLNMVVCCQGETKDIRYPYAYDFYFREKDLFIEINGSWTHGGHWFDAANPEDVETVNMWKNKCTPYYENAIETWTKRDVNKRETAKQNDLNYVTLWNREDIDLWFSLGCPVGKDWKQLYSWNLT